MLTQSGRASVLSTQGFYVALTVLFAALLFPLHPPTPVCCDGFESQVNVSCPACYPDSLELAGSPACSFFLSSDGLCFLQNRIVILKIA